MNREELYKIACDYNLNQRNGYYKVKKIDSQYVLFEKKSEPLDYSFWLRIQYDKILSTGILSIVIKKIEKHFKSLIIEELIDLYYENLNLSFYEFRPTDYHFDITIETDDDWQTFLNEFDKCLKFYEAEIFPKLTDIKFLAQYVGVPWENRSNIVVGGKYPVHLFKKLAILKWGDQLARYEEYKWKLKKFIDEDYKDPKYGHEAKTYEEGYNKLINHLENEPNPFEEKKD